MKHKFKVINKSKLDSPKRREALPVDKVLAKIGVKKSDIDGLKRKVIMDLRWIIGWIQILLKEILVEPDLKISK